MKKFLCKSCVFALVFAVALLAACFGLYQLMIAHPNKWALHSHEINVQHSVERLKRKTSPSVIIIGGSGCAFGFISPLLSEHYQMPVINTGTHAGLGLRLQVLLVKPYVKEGDIVLVIPEYEQFTKTFYGSGTAWRIITATIPEAISDISCKQYLYISKYFFTALKDSFSAHAPSPTSPYSANSLNEYGDVTFYERRGHRRISIPKKHQQEDIKNEAVSFLKDFQEYCLHQSATFLLFPTAFQEKSYENDKEFIHAIEDKLDEAETPYLVETKRYALPDSLFYDTSHHLTYDGCLVRTQMIIHDVDSCLQNQ
ncbi:MAG: hypothetical protein ACI3Z8_02975 [Paludibacteraceae bacterium]